MSLQYIYIGEVLVWTHTDTSFLISHMSAPVVERFIIGVL
jgi:hypothetical protein